VSERAIAGLTFVDTNVLAYALDRSEVHRQPIAEALLDELWGDRTGVISTQVLQEFHVVATRRFDPPLSSRAARSVISAYGAWPVVAIDLPMILQASALEERHSFSFWDALIVEAARRAGASRIVSADLQTGRRIAGLVVENPFAV
jgi:predicted nucleic acid-binding protein